MSDWEAIKDAVLDGIHAANIRYEEWSRGWWVTDSGVEGPSTRDEVVHCEAVSETLEAHLRCELEAILAKTVAVSSPVQCREYSSELCMADPAGTP